MERLWLANGRIADGTGSAAYKGGLLIGGDRIIQVGGEKPAGEVREIDCGGSLIAPGFIDIHSHLDWFTGNEGSRDLILPFLKQGITTAVGGNCGFSVFGFPPEHPYRELLANNIFRSGRASLEWNILPEFEEHLKKNGTPLNLVSYVGHGTTRTSLKGYDPAELSEKELRGMLDLMDSSLKDGAAGISMGLQYEPGIFADRKEMTAMAELAASHKKILAVHSRAASAVSGTYPMKPFGRPHHLLAIEDMISLAEQTGVRLQFSHLIFVGTRSWKTAGKAFRLFEEAVQRGVDIAFDTYGYSLGASRINVILPEWFLTDLKGNLKNKKALRRLRLEIAAMQMILGFGYDQIRVTNTVDPAWEEFNGLTVTEIALRRRTGRFETLCDLIRVSGGTANVLMERYSSPEILEQMIAHPLSLYQTDAWAEREGINNPAIYGSLPRILRLSREKNLQTAEQAIRKMTGAAADRVGLTDRGYLKEGYFADITVLDETAVSERTGAAGEPLPPEGIHRVFVNGRETVGPDGAGENAPGRFLRI